MATPLQDRLLAAAEADAGLVALLGSSPFRWFYDSLPQGSTFPAVVAQQISSSNTYVLNSRLATSYTRFQFMIWGGKYAAGAAAREAVTEALKNFLDGFSGAGIAGLTQQSNYVVLERDFLFVQSDTPIYQKIIDCQIFTDERI